MTKEKMTELLKTLEKNELDILYKILEAEKEVLHKKTLHGTQVRRNIYNLIKKGVDKGDF